jgi:hypothetical protein
MYKVSRFILWLLQILSLGTILWCSWLLLDTTVFALVASVIVLFVSLYAEHQDIKYGSTEGPSEGGAASDIPVRQ